MVASISWGSAKDLLIEHEPRIVKRGIIPHKIQSALKYIGVESELYGYDYGGSINNSILHIGLQGRKNPHHYVICDSDGNLIDPADTVIAWNNIGCFGHVLRIK